MKSNNSTLAISLILIVGIFLSLLSGKYFYDKEEKGIIEEFKQEINEYSSTIYREITIQIEALHTLSILFHTKNNSLNEKFEIEASNILKRHQKIHSLAWAQKELDNNQQFPIKLIEPKENKEFKNQINNKPTYLKLIKDSLKNETPKLSSSIKFKDKDLGFLITLAVPENIYLDDEKIRGFIVGIYSFKKLFPTSQLDDEYEGIEIKILDITNKEKKEVLLTHNKNSLEQTQKDIYYTKNIPKILNKQWSLVATPSKQYISEKRDLLPYTIALLGIVLTLFISIYIYIISKRARLVEKLVQRKTKELNKANETLKKISRTDALTTISNRRYMDEFLEKRV